MRTKNFNMEMLFLQVEQMFSTIGRSGVESYERSISLMSIVNCIDVFCVEHE